MKKKKKKKKTNKKKKKEKKKKKSTANEEKEAAASKARKVVSTRNSPEEAPETPPLENPALEEEKRDRIKSAKLKSLWHLLPAGLKDIVDNLGRDERKPNLSTLPSVRSQEARRGNWS